MDDENPEAVPELDSSDAQRTDAEAIHENPEAVSELDSPDAQRTDAEVKDTVDDPRQEILAAELSAERVEDLAHQSTEESPRSGTPQCEAASTPSELHLAEPEKPTASNALISPWGDPTVGPDYASEDPSPLSPPSPRRGKSAAVVGLTNGTQRPRAGRTSRCGELGAAGTLLRRGRAWPRGGGYSFDPYVGEVCRRTPCERARASNTARARVRRRALG
jgi:hypothetical protein